MVQSQAILRNSADFNYCRKVQDAWQGRARWTSFSSTLRMHLTSLLHKLDFYGVRESTLRWTESFLRQRKQSVLLSSTRSTEAYVLSGMPQGTVLGPLLFLMFINDLPESTKHSDARLFADDCLLYKHVQTSQDSALLHEDLSTLERKEETWQIKFHPEKCTFIRISTNRRHIIKTNYQVHGHSLEVVDSSKYLDVTFSEDLTWRKHTDKVKKNPHLFCFMEKQPYAKS